MEASSIQTAKTKIHEALQETMDQHYSKGLSKTGAEELMQTRWETISEELLQDRLPEARIISSLMFELWEDNMTEMETLLRIIWEDNPENLQDDLITVAAWTGNLETPRNSRKLLMELVETVRERTQQEIVPNPVIFQESGIGTLAAFMKQNYENQPEMQIYRWWMTQDPDLLKNLYYRESQIPGSGDRLTAFLESQMITSREEHEITAHLKQEFLKHHGIPADRLKEMETSPEYETEELEWEEEWLPHLEMLVTEFPMELRKMHEENLLLDYMLHKRDLLPPENSLAGMLTEDTETALSFMTVTENPTTAP